METRVEIWVILTHNSLFRHTCRVVAYSVYSTFEHLTQQRYTMSIIQSRVLYSAFEQALSHDIFTDRSIFRLLFPRKRSAGARFSKGPETFWALKAIFL